MITKSKIQEIIKEEFVKALNENLKISKGHGRGQSWTNYDDGTHRMQVTKNGNEYFISIFKIGSSNKRMIDLMGLSKQEAAKVVLLAKKNGLVKTAKLAKSKFKKYVSEGKLNENPLVQVATRAVPTILKYGKKTVAPLTAPLSA